MVVRVVVIGDTHVLNFEELPQEMIEAVHKADWVIHVGDYNSENVLNGLIALKGQYFKGVYGNTDPQSIRDKVPFKDIIELFLPPRLN